MDEVTYIWTDCWWPSLSTLYFSFQIHGPNGEFYTLSKTCYKANFDKYTYEVCPFREVKQTFSALPYTYIGRNGKWVSTGKQGWTLLMDHGEPRQCPQGRPRITYVSFNILTDFTIHMIGYLLCILVPRRLSHYINLYYLPLYIQLTCICIVK